MLGATRGVSIILVLITGIARGVSITLAEAGVILGVSITSAVAGGEIHITAEAGAVLTADVSLLIMLQLV